MADITSYPRWTLRVEAALIDTVVILLAFFGSALLVAHSGLPAGARVTIVATVILALEPGMVSWNGATIGHFARGLRVRHAITGNNLNIPTAFLRFIVKMLLGWLSLLLVLTTRHHQAIHDMASRSVVVIAKGSKQAERNVLREQNIEEAGYIYPAKWWRVICIMLYALFGAVVLTIFAALFVSDDCNSSDICNPREQIIWDAVAYCWLILLGAAFYYGWRGRLWGCRRKLNAED